MAKEDQENQEISNFSVRTDLYKGTCYSDEEIFKAIKKSKLKGYKCKKPSMLGAYALTQNLIIGWFQGKMEIGARALGGRSILANPLYEDSRDLVNATVKNREKWRPFCPSMCAEDFNNYFKGNGDYSYMIVACEALEKTREIIPACVHVDNTVRVQCVKKNQNEKYYYLISNFGKLTSHPIVLNTSFNIAGEPIVESPEQAIRCFSASGMDLLLIENFALFKPNKENLIKELVDNGDIEII